MGTDCPAGKTYENICKRVMGEEVPLMDLESKKGVVTMLKGLFKGK